METTVQFEEILNAFVAGDKQQCILLLNQGLLKSSIPNKDMIIELREKGIAILPRRTKEFETKLKENFVYEIADKKLAEEVFNAVMADNEAMFENLLQEKGLKEQYLGFEKKFSKDALINWLVKSDITLPGQELVPNIEISEIDAKTVPDEMKSLVPTVCNNCSNKLGFTPSYFKTSLPCDNLLLEANAKKIMTTKGFENFNFLGRERKELISAASCPRCKSTDLTWDFK